MVKIINGMKVLRFENIGHLRVVELMCQETIIALSGSIGYHFRFRVDKFRQVQSAQLYKLSLQTAVAQVWSQHRITGFHNVGFFQMSTTERKNN